MSLALGLSGLVPVSLPTSAWLALAMAAGLGFLALRASGTALLPLLAWATGELWSAEIEARRPPPILQGFESGERAILRLVGTIREESLALEETAERSWIVKLDSVETPSGSVSVSGRFRLRMKEAGEPLRLGDRIEAFGRWRAPPPPSNPHEIARDRREFRREIWGSLECAPGCVTRLSRPGFSLARWLHAMRARALETLRRDFPADSAALAAPLLLGVWPRESQDTIDLFRKTGAIHLLAVSGMHVSLLFGAAAMGALRRSRRRGALLVSLTAFLFFYAGLTGFQIPVLRAAIMLGLSCAAWALRRPCDAMSALGAGAWIACCLAPSEIEGPSFQLSFAATAGMILLGPALGARVAAILPQPFARKKSGRSLALAAGVSLAAFVASLGLVVLHYRILPHGSIPATLLATPFLPPLMLAGYALLLAPTAAQTIFAWGFALLQEPVLLLLRACESALGPPLPLCGIPWALPAGAAIGIALLLADKAKLVGRLLLVAACAGAPILSRMQAPSRDALRIDILDAGHGNAIVVRTPDGRCLLFDAGSSSRPDLARAVLLPFLHAEGIRRIDRLVLSHGDADHWNALPGIRDAIPIEQTICGEGVRRQAESKLPRQAREALLDAAGPLFWESGGVRALLWRAAPGQCLTENDGSLCLRLRFAGRSILLCGDLEEDGIRAFLDADEEWECDLLLLPHHGLPAEGLDDLLERTGPQWAVASCGRQFRAEGLAPPGWERRFLSTASAGAIRVEIRRDGSWRLETHRAASMMAARKSP